MNQRQALVQIEQIREQLARAEVFRVYRSASVAFTGAAALIGSLIQSHWRLDDSESFLLLWLSIALICIVVVSMEMVIRCRWSESALLRDAAIIAARQFTPSIVAGGLLTVVAHQSAPALLPMLPGLWAIIFSLGIFASRQGLPPAINFVGAYYLLAGLLIIALTHDHVTFDIWPMPLTFGVGQLLIAVILYMCTERNHESR